MTKDKLIEAWTKYRGRCSTEDIQALSFAYDTLKGKSPEEKKAKADCKTCIHYLEVLEEGVWRGYCYNNGDYTPAHKAVKACERYENYIDYEFGIT